MTFQRRTNPQHRQQATFDRRLNAGPAALERCGRLGKLKVCGRHGSHPSAAMVKVGVAQAVSQARKDALRQLGGGQGKFRERVSKIEHACRITRVNRPEHLIASHCKPWRDCESNDERLDGENGLLLTPTVDHLFDRGFISFENNGDVLVSPVVHRESLKRMGIEVAGRVNVGAFSQGQRRYLEFHREAVFLEARVRR